jgi:hypothetical protein
MGSIKNYNISILILRCLVHQIQPQRLKRTVFTGEWWFPNEEWRTNEIHRTIVILQVQQCMDVPLKELYSVTIYMKINNMYGDSLALNLIA